MATTTSRTIVRQGVAAYFGGTKDPATYRYLNGPLLTSGLAVVRAGYPKRLDERDAFVNLPAGRMSGAFMVVVIGDDVETRDSNAGAPVLDTNTPPNIIAGGIKDDIYQVSLDVYHVSHEQYAELAQEDVDLLIEAVKQRLRIDRTLGGICMDGGETNRGIRTQMRHSGTSADGKRTLTSFSVSFEIRVQFIA